jgi:hypothetical protein
MYLLTEFSILPLFLLLALWAVGGFLIVSRCDLPANERGLVGLGVGLTLAALLANLTGRFLPTTSAFWLAGALTLIIGLALASPALTGAARGLPASARITRDQFPIAQWVSFLIVTFFLTLLGRGLGIFDDHQNLPQISSMALGDLPPHFVFDPRLLWSYHYFLLLVATQFTRLAQAGPWASLDLARGLTLALTLFLAGMLALRLTGSRLAATVSAAFLFFVGGARWILLLLPASLLSRISASLTLIGSGADTGPNLGIALYKYWKIQGLGPLPFPFVYGSGLDPSLTMAHAGYGVSAVMLVLLVILLSPSLKIGKEARGEGGWVQQAIVAILLAALALANEVTFAFVYVGLIFAILVWMLANRSLKLPASLWAWAPALIGAGIIALLQGGIFTGVLLGFLGKFSGLSSILGGSADVGGALYKVSFALRLPAVLSAHVGTLSLFNPLHWFVILAETGLVIFALPWAFQYGRQLVRDEKWLEAAWVFSMIPSLLTIFVEYTGNAGPTALSRMTAHFLMVLKLYAVPLLWLWGREKSAALQNALFGWGLASALSGLALLSLQITGMPNPYYADYLTYLDVRMFNRNWGTLDTRALIFDPNPVRGTTILGLHSLSANNYGPPAYPEWLALAENPDPAALNRAGYRYLYLDLPFWRKYADHFTQPCVKILDDQRETSADGKVTDMRILMDVGSCK